MLSRLMTVLVCAGLSGCAFVSDVEPLAIQVSAATPGLLQTQLHDVLAEAGWQREKYKKFAGELNKEQKGRAAALFVATTGLSATAIFRGGANSLRYAGFFTGLPLFYDKALPISTRIQGARTAFANYNLLILVGDEALAHDLDAGDRLLGNDLSALDSEIAKAEMLVAQPAREVAKTAQAQADQDKADLANLVTALAAARTVRTNGAAAMAALKSLPSDVRAASYAIDKAGQESTAFAADKDVLAAGFITVTPPTNTPPKTTTTKIIKNTLSHDLASEMAPQTDSLEAATQRVQEFLGSVDYVDIDGRIKRFIPNAAPPPKPNG